MTPRKVPVCSVPAPFSAAGVQRSFEAIYLASGFFCLVFRLFLGLYGV
jgi:hypothetical protein